MRKSLSISLMISICASAVTAPALCQGLVGAPLCPWLGGIGSPAPLNGICVNECRNVAFVLISVVAVLTIVAHRREALDSVTASFIVCTLIGSVPTGWAIASLCYPKETAAHIAGYQHWAMTIQDLALFSISACTTTCLLSAGLFGPFGAILGMYFHARRSAPHTQILGCADRRKNFNTSRRPIVGKKKLKAKKYAHVAIALVIAWNWCGWSFSRHLGMDPNHGGVWTENSFLLGVMYDWDDPIALIHDAFE